MNRIHKNLAQPAIIVRILRGSADALKNSLDRNSQLEHIDMTL